MDEATEKEVATLRANIGKVAELRERLLAQQAAYEELGAYPERAAARLLAGESIGFDEWFSPEVASVLKRVCDTACHDGCVRIDRLKNPGLGAY